MHDVVLTAAVVPSVFAENFYAAATAFDTIPSRKSNHISSKIWDKITHSLQNANVFIVDDRYLEVILSHNFKWMQLHTLAVIKVPCLLMEFQLTINTLKKSLLNPSFEMKITWNTKSDASEKGMVLKQFLIIMIIIIMVIIKFALEWCLEYD